MTSPDPAAIRDAADRADSLLAEAEGPLIGDAWPDHACDALSVLVPAARTAADLLDAIGNPKRYLLAMTQQGEHTLMPDEKNYLRRIADAAAAVRREQ